MSSVHKMNCLKVPTPRWSYMMCYTVDVVCIITLDVKSENMMWKRISYLFTAVFYALIMKKQQYDRFMITSVIDRIAHSSLDYTLMNEPL